MSDSVRILTYNTQLRSWGMEALAQQSLFPTTSAEERAETIAKRILQSPEDYDVVCLNEVFDEDAREVLVHRLRGKYPNAVIKADIDNLALQIGILSGTVLGATALLAIPVIGWLGALGVAAAGLAALTSTTFEDSGVMVFSRLPFASLPVTPETRQILEQLGFSEPVFPITTFVPYEDGANDDALAAKGVVYAQFVRANGKPLHVLASHTQSDPTKSPGQNAGVRASQFGQVAKLIDQMIGSGPLHEEVVFCGDFNIDGAFHGKSIVPFDAVSQEWRDRFNSGGSKFTDTLHDVWHYEQCPGFDSSGATVLPDNFDRGITIYNRDNQRLDYFLRPLKFPGRLATQHIAIAYDVAEGPPGALTAYTSDHLPLKLDLNHDRPRSGVIRAEVIPISIAQPDITVSGVIQQGEMDWFRIDAKGGYGLRLEHHGGDVGFEVYGPTNLSVPLAPFTVMGEPSTEHSPFGTRFVLPDPPYLVRVFLKDRRSEASYDLHVHRFLGTSELDAIPLLPGVPFEGEARAGAPHCLDDSSTPFDEFDSVWFVTQLDADPTGAIDVKATAKIVHPDQNAFGVLVLGREPPHHRFELTEASEGQDPVIAEFDFQRPLGGLLLARRRDPSFTARSFTISIDTNLNYLYGRPPLARALPSLFCEDETDGFLGNECGSDDISFNIEADGRLAVHADNEDDLEFDDDTRRDLDRWIDVVRYTNQAEFELVELDDLSPVDRASVTIPRFDQVIAHGKVDPDTEPGKAHAEFRIAFDDDDGIYHLKITVSNRPPPQ